MTPVNDYVQRQRRQTKPRKPLEVMLGKIVGLAKEFYPSAASASTNSGRDKSKRMFY